MNKKLYEINIRFCPHGLVTQTNNEKLYFAAENISFILSYFDESEYYQKVSFRNINLISNSIFIQ